MKSAFTAAVVAWVAMLALSGCESAGVEGAAPPSAGQTGSMGFVHIGPGIDAPVFNSHDADAGRQAGHFTPLTVTSGSADFAELPYVANSTLGSVPGQPTQFSIQPDTTQPSAVQRIIIYSGSIHLVVANINSTVESIRQMAESLGGYLQDMDSHSITVRIPAPQFDQAVALVEKKGEVADKQIKAADVTEQMRDLNIRLENAEQTRQRLLKLLDQSTKVEDTVKIEDELEKVTEQVELLKGKIRYMQLDVAYSVLHVELNSPVAQEKVIAAVPFPWVRELGQGVVSGNTPETAKQGGFFSGGVGFDLPPSYVRFYQQDDLTEAMSADGIMIKVQRHENYKGGDVKFWTTLARKSLVENQSMVITPMADGKNSARLIEGTKDTPGNTQGYLLMVSVDGGHVYSFEAWGAKPAMDADLALLEKSAESVNR